MGTRIDVRMVRFSSSRFAQGCIFFVALVLSAFSVELELACQVSETESCRHLCACTVVLWAPAALALLLS